MATCGYRPAPGAKLHIARRRCHSLRLFMFTRHSRFFVPSSLPRHLSNIRMASTTAPQTFAEALQRIQVLEDQLALAHRAFHEHTGGKSLSDYLERSPSPLYRSVSQASSESESSRPSSPRLSADRTGPLPTPPLPGSKPQPQVASKPKPPVDIGAFVLRALALRKNLTIGAVDSLEAEGEFGRIVKGSGLNDKQVAQVREWAGLA